MDNIRLTVNGVNCDLSPEFEILINRSIAEIKEPDKRNSDWTKTFILPGSKANRKLFSHLFEINYSIQATTQFTPDFNPNLKADAALYIDEVPEISGFIRLLKINIIDDDQVEFECSMYGQLADLFATVSEGRLRELDFTEFNHILTATRVFESWDTRIQKNGGNYTNFDASGNPTGEGYVYALIDDGSYVNYYGDTNVSQFYPALYAKEIVDKIIEGAGYSYTSDSFFNDAFFKRLIVPCPTGMQLAADDVEGRLFEAQASGTQSTTTTNTPLNFPSETFDNGNNYDPSTSIFTSPVDGKYDFYLYTNAEVSGLPISTFLRAIYALVIDGVVYRNVTVSFTTDGLGEATLDNTVLFGNIPVYTGQEVEVRIEMFVDPSTGLITSGWTHDLLAGAKFYNAVITESWGLNGPVDFNAFFNDDTKQTDFLKGIFNLFNLYVEPDPDNPVSLFIQTRDSFYRSTVKDWTQRLDYSQPYELVPMGELDGNPYYFTYTKGEDVENKDYQASFNRIYGDKKYFVDNDFVKDEKKIEVLFAPAQVYTAPGYDKTLTYIPMEMDNGTGQLRLLYYSGLEACSSYKVYDDASMSGSSTTKVSYPFTAHIDSPTAPTLDLCYGMPRRINIPAGTLYTNNNMFNLYWKKYIDEITDKNSKLFRGWFYISPAAMERLSFRDAYYFENNYFRLNRIDDYNPVTPGLTYCEFLLLNTGLDFVPSSGGTSGGGEDEFGDLFPETTRHKDIDGSDFGQVALVVGRNNGNAGEQSLLVGDDIVTSQGSRINTALGSTGIKFMPDVQRATVLNSANVTPETADLWIFSRRMEIANFEYEVYTETSFPVIASYTTGHHVIFLNMGSGIGTVTLPTAVGNKAHLTFVKVSADANVATIAAGTGETINGVGSRTLTAQYDKFTIVSNNSDWIVIG